MTLVAAARPTLVPGLSAQRGVVAAILGPLVLAIEQGLHGLRERCVERALLLLQTPQLPMCDPPRSKKQDHAGSRQFGAARRIGRKFGRVGVSEGAYPLRQPEKPRVQTKPARWSSPVLRRTWKRRRGFWRDTIPRPPATQPRPAGAGRAFSTDSVQQLRLHVGPRNSDSTVRFDLSDSSLQLSALLERELGCVPIETVPKLANEIEPLIRSHCVDVEGGPKALCYLEAKGLALPHHLCTQQRIDGHVPPPPMRCDMRAKNAIEPHAAAHGRRQ